MGSDTIDAEALAAANGLPLLGRGTAWASTAAAADAGDGLGAGCGRVREVAQPPVAGAFTITGEGEAGLAADAAGESEEASSTSDGRSSTPASSGPGASIGASCRVVAFIGSLGMIVVAGSISMALAVLPIMEAGPASIQAATARYRHPSTICLLQWLNPNAPGHRAFPRRGFAIINQ
jgi:hypothetical protein